MTAQELLDRITKASESFNARYGEAMKEKKAKLECDCGAKKTNQPGHSTWCKTEE